jgi:DNA polymerase-3 subunit gamma/tau
MSYQVLARKWRPQTFEEVTGQETVTRTLQNAILSGRIAHAFLFSGVRGVGKTTTARILAKALNCAQGPTPSPCGVCVSCVEITAGNSIDVLEIDAASNNGVDNIRDLRESVRYGTSRDRFKIFIIDEVHMLSNQAFNALLKTLEEPPAHVKFVLATTEHHKIPVTITSRCQQYEFKPIAFSQIWERLAQISREEGIEISEWALRAVTSGSQGSMRDAQSALDRIIAFTGKRVSDDDARSLLGVVDEKLVGAALDAVLKKDRKDVLSQMQVLSGEGIDPQLFCRRLLERVRDLMVYRTAGWDSRLLHLPDYEKEAVARQADQLSEVDLIRFYDVLNRTENDLRWHPHPQIHLEMALIKLVELSRLPMLEEVLGRLGAGERAIGVPASAQGAKAEQPAPPARPTTSGTPETAAQAAAPVAGSTVGGASESPAAHLMAAVQRENLALYSSLSHAASVALEGGKLRVQFRSSESFHARQVEDAANLERLTRLGGQIVGSPVQVVVIRESQSRSEHSDLTEDPLVRSFLERFPGKVIVQRNVEKQT